MRVLITGITGMAGSFLAEYLTNEHPDVEVFGTFRWRSNDNRCLVTPFAGTGTATLPLLQEANGDTDAIKAPPGKLAVHVENNQGGNCTVRLSDAANGQALDVVPWEPGDGDFTLDPADRASVYVSDDNCIIRISAQG